MFLETRLDEQTIIFIDAEPSGALDKAGARTFHHPDEALENLMKLAGQVAARAGALAQAGGMDRLSVTFGVRVDGNAAVCVARNADEGQLKVTAEWKKASSE